MSTDSPDLPFTEDQIRAVCDVLEGDEALTRRVLGVLAESMKRDCQYRGMYGPLRAWRVAGPWQKVDA